MGPDNRVLKEACQLLANCMLFGGLSASSGVLQRRLNLPDASVEVLKGIMFVMILLFDTLYGRFRAFQPRLALLVDREEEAGAPSAERLALGASRPALEKVVAK